MQQDFLEQLDASVADVFRVMLNQACTWSPVPPLASQPEPALIATVTFLGSIEGTCDLRLGMHTAAELTSMLTGIPPVEVAPELCADTAGELCNMIAGSWKCIHQGVRQRWNEGSDGAPAICHMSCPAVVCGPARLMPSQPESINRIYHFAGHSFQVSLNFAG